MLSGDRFNKPAFYLHPHVHEALNALGVIADYHVVLVQSFLLNSPK